MNGSEAFRAVRRARPFERDGRKVIVTSNGTDLGIVLGQRVDNAMVKALARAFRRRTLQRRKSILPTSAAARA